jgi:hypothetical protein
MERLKVVGREISPYLPDFRRYFVVLLVSPLNPSYIRNEMETMYFYGRICSNFSTKEMKAFMYISTPPLRHRNKILHIVNALEI